MNTILGHLPSVPGFVLWSVAFLDRGKGSSPNKGRWVIVSLVLPFLGSILNFLFGRAANGS